MEFIFAPFIIGAIVVGIGYLKKKDTQNGIIAFYTATILCGIVFANRFVQTHHGGSYYGSDFEQALATGFYSAIIYVAVSVIFFAVILGYMFIKEHERIGCGIFCILIACVFIFLAISFFVNHDAVWDAAQGTADAVSLITIGVIIFILVLFMILF